MDFNYGKPRQDTYIETYSQTPLLLTGPGLPVRSDMRAWVMAGGEAERILGNGLPLWAQMMKWGEHEGVEEALALGSSPNLRDHWGRGWLWWGTQTQMPPALVLAGLPLLDETWWQADQASHSPFHHPHLNPSVAHAMACRWWADGLSWQSLCRHGDPLATAREHGRWDLVSMWQGTSSLPWFTRP